MSRSFFNREKITVRNNNKAKTEDKTSFKLSKTLQTNLDNISNILDKPDDLKMRELKLGEANIPCAFVHMEGIVDAKTIQISILENLEDAQNLPQEAKEMFDFIFNKLISINDIKIGKTLDDISLSLLSGHTIIYIDGIEQALIINTTGGEMRSITEPVTETLIRGPREGFVENLQTNLAMIRRNLKDPNLRFHSYQVGRRSKKSLVLAYVNGIIHPDLVKEVKRRVKSIDIDVVPESGIIEAWIQDSFLSPFPQMMNSERPDKVIAALMQGKVAIFLDGTPFVLLAPITFVNVLQSPEDYYERWTIGSLLRILRYSGAFISVFLPALYISLITVEPGMIPSDLSFSIAASREGVPFPPIVEAVLMIATMELLQEAGARLPQTIGQTIGIVGGLVIGEAAVQAGIVSPIMVVVTALTAIANFAIPAYSTAITFRIIRFTFMFAASIFGLFGIVLAYIMVNIHLVNLKSFGVPYSAPFAPFFPNDWNDVFVRAPNSSINKRPAYMRPQDEISADTQGEEK